MRVVNAAVNGHVSTDELTLLEKELLDLEPSLILALDGFNDSQIGYVLAGERTMTNSTFRDFEYRLTDWRARRTNPLWASWGLVRALFRELGGRVEKLERLPSRIRQDWYGEMPDDQLDARLEIYTRNVHRMTTLAKERDIAFLVLLQPQRANVWRYWKYYSERYNLFLRRAVQTFEREGVEYFDLHALDQIKKTHFLGGDDVHFNGDGVEVIAEIVAAHIRDRGLLGSPEGARKKSRQGSPFRNH